MFTPDNIIICIILLKIKENPGFIRHPKLITIDFKRNNDKYYNYPWDRGRNTDECYHLKKMIEQRYEDER